MKISIRDLAAFAAVLSLVLSSPSHAAELVVSAAASLTNAFTDIGREFESSHAGTKVLFNFAGSGQLLQQRDARHLRIGDALDLFDLTIFEIDRCRAAKNRDGDFDAAFVFVDFLEVVKKQFPCFIAKIQPKKSPLLS